MGERTRWWLARYFSQVRPETENANGSIGKIFDKDKIGVNDPSSMDRNKSGHRLWSRSRRQSDSNPGEIMIVNKDQDYWASCYCTDKFLLIETQSGLGMVAADPLFPSHLLQPDASESDVGEAILKALSDSRTLNVLEERMDFFDLEKGKENYANWIAMLMDRYGYRSKKALFKDMKNSGIHLVNDTITISPTRHEKLQGWGRNKGDGIEDVILTADSSPFEIGVGLRLALSRCKG